MGELLTGRAGPISSTEIVQWGVLLKREQQAAGEA